MNLLHPRAPLWFGSAMITLLGGYLLLHHPAPGDLSAAHARLAGVANLAGCQSCHSDEGLEAGCLSCHSEIYTQLSSKTGYHGYLYRDGRRECERCHSEHLGSGFELVNAASWKGPEKESFKHVHVPFSLSGAHDSLECADCHEDQPRSWFNLPGFPRHLRRKTFLGLSQECDDCHEDVHEGGLEGPCTLCHDQHAFRPAPFFNHDEHFPLLGAHDGADCGGCHPTPETRDGRYRSLPFHSVRGRECLDCHERPHFTTFAERCEACHPMEEPTWSSAREGMTAEVHSQTGFRLVPPHVAVRCNGCHPDGLSYDRRFRHPQSPGYRRREETCDGCHRDVHDGQFAGRGAECLDCHEPLHFQPASFGLARHEAVYPLRGAHRAVLCHDCHRMEHGVRMFAGTTRRCHGCHLDPHAGQFARDVAAGDCVACHDDQARTFQIRPFDHALRTGYRLLAAHARATCRDCHRALPHATGDGKVRAGEVAQFRGTSLRCASCHIDVHRGQFREYGQTSCERCHASFEIWSAETFDHNRTARFPLEGAHAQQPCESCHPTVRLRDGSDLVRYRPLGKECKDCHEIETK